MRVRITINYFPLLWLRIRTRSKRVTDYVGSSCVTFGAARLDVGAAGNERQEQSRKRHSVQFLDGQAPPAKGRSNIVLKHPLGLTVWNGIVKTEREHG